MSFYEIHQLTLFVLIIHVHERYLCVFKLCVSGRKNYVFCETAWLCKLNQYFIFSVKILTTDSFTKSKLSESNVENEVFKNLQHFK